MYHKVNYFLTHPFVKFVLVGGASTVCQFSALIFLVEVLAFNPVIASASSYLCGAVCNYLLNYYITFRMKSCGHMDAFPKFVLVVIIGLSVNTSVFTLFLAFLDLYLVAQLIAISVTLVVNYLLHRYWIYSDKDPVLNKEYKVGN